jgi:hypothetical protein
VLGDFSWQIVRRSGMSWEPEVPTQESQRSGIRRLFDYLQVFRCLLQGDT